MPTNDERREVAEKLRDMATTSNPSWPALMEALGCPGRAVAVLYLVDLIDPTEHERTIADNLALIDRNRELECELAALKAKLGGGGPARRSARRRGRRRDVGGGAARRPRAPHRPIDQGSDRKGMNHDR